MAQWLGAGAEGLWNNLRVKAADDCRETDGGDVREEIVVGNVWRKPRQPWKQGDTAESSIGDEPITIASLSPHTSIGS